MEEQEREITTSPPTSIIDPNLNPISDRVEMELSEPTSMEEIIIEEPKTSDENSTSAETTATTTIHAEVNYLKLIFDKSNENQGSLILTSKNGEFGFTKDSIPFYTKGVKWSPDGLCLLTNSNDNIV